MSRPGDPQHHRYLNGGGRWEGFDHVGLDRTTAGALTLQALPRLDGPAPAWLVGLPAPPPGGLAGVVALPGGLVLFTDPASHRLLLVDACDGTRRPLPCLSGPGDGVEELRTPRGLAWHRGRDVVLVADGGNDRVVVLDRSSLRSVELWRGLPGACSVAVDGESGAVYVVTASDGALVRLDARGWRDAEFAARAGDELHAAAVAVHGEHVVVLEADGGHVRLLDRDGGHADRWATDLAAPLGLAAGGGAVYLGDNATRTLVAFDARGGRRGAAVGYAGAVGAVACDREDGLLVHPGDAAAGPLRLRTRGGFATHGVLWGGPFASPDDTDAPRHLLRAAVDAAPGAHVQLAICEQPDAGAAAPPVDPRAADPFANPRWKTLRIGLDATETLLSGAPRDAICVGAVFTGEGATSPALHQIRIDFAHDTYLQHLPAVYKRDPDSAGLLARWLTVFESGSDHVQAGIDGLAALADPTVAPARWLPWLAGWLALDLPDAWDDGRRRTAIAGAFGASARRGTVAGLRAALRERAGVEAVVEEPILQTSWWLLAAGDATEPEAALSVLGAGTVLARAEGQGAVLGTSAVLDGSFLTPQEDYAQPLFDDVAHQFTVRLYRGATHSEDAVAAALAVLDAERPAHTACHVCVVEPRLRVGVQARLGIDAIVAGPPGPEPSPLQDTGTGALVLDGPPTGRLGATTRIGQTHLTDG